MLSVPCGPWFGHQMRRTSELGTGVEDGKRTTTAERHKAVRATERIRAIRLAAPPQHALETTHKREHVHYRDPRIWHEHQDMLSPYHCEETCEMTIGAVGASSQSSKKCRHTTNGKKRVRTFCERTMVRDILTKEHRPRKTHWKCCRSRDRSLNQEQSVFC